MRDDLPTVEHARLEDCEAALRTLHRRLVDLERESIGTRSSLHAARNRVAELAELCATLEADLAAALLELDEARLAASAAEEQVAALHATKVLRWSSAPRAVYAQVRRGTGRERPGGTGTA